MLTSTQMLAALLTVADMAGRGWKKDRSPTVTDSDQWRPKRCDTRMDAFGKAYFIKGNTDARAQVSFERGKDFNQQSLGEVIIRQGDAVTIADVEAEIADLVEACPQMTPVPDKTSNSLDVPVVRQLTSRDTPQY
jgi:hypothetical protein